MTVKDILERVSRTSRQRKKLQKQIVKNLVFVTGDAKGMVEYMARSSNELEYDFWNKPKVVSQLAKNIFQEYINGVSALPFTRTVPSQIGFDLSRQTRKLDPMAIQGLAEVAGHILVRPVVGFESITYECFTPSEFIPVVATRSGELLEVTLIIDQAAGIYEHWTPWSTSLIMGDRLMWEDINPYQRLPFVSFRGVPQLQTWLGDSEFDPVVENNNIINLQWTNILTLADTQTFSIYVIEGLNKKEEDRDGSEPDPSTEQGIELRKHKVMVLPEGASLKTVTPDADIDALVKTVTVLDAKTRDEAFVPILTEKYTAGFALNVRRGGYLRHMKKKRILFEKADAELVALGVQVWEVAQTGEARALNDDFQVVTTIDAKTLTPTSSQEDTLAKQFQLANGLISPVQLIMEQQGLSEVEAEAAYRSNIELQKAVQTNNQ